MSRKKQTKYTQYRNRILRQIRKLKKQGLEVDFNYPTEKALRKMGAYGQGIRKYTLELKKYTPQYIRSIATPIKTDWTENVQPINLFDEVMATSISENKILFIKDELRRYKPEIRDKINALIDTLINEQGIDDVAESFSKMEGRFFDYLEAEQFASNAAVQNFSSALINFLPNASRRYKEDIAEQFDAEELGYTDYEM